jgi:hypothetical protein
MRLRKSMGEWRRINQDSGEAFVVDYVKGKYPGFVPASGETTSARNSHLKDMPRSHPEHSKA